MERMPVPNFGKWLKRQIESTLLSQKQWAAKHAIPFDTLKVWLGEAKPKIRGTNLERLGIALKMQRDELEELINSAGVSPGIPTFDRNLAAGAWTEAVMVDESDVSPEQFELGLFRVKISGDSMLPKYKDGCTVEFRVLRIADDGLEVGGDFYIQRDDGMATLKRVSAIGEELVVLHALNRKKYAEPFPVARGRIVRAARAVYILKDAKNG
jgi:hypothetical protein